MMTGFSWVFENKIGGLARPSSLDDFRLLKKQGVKALISLTRNGPPLEILRDYGLTNYCFPIDDMGVPSSLLMDGIVEAIHAEVTAGNKVGVHCAAGMGRTGTVLACYLVFRGMSGRDAIVLVRTRRPGSIETQEQERFVMEYEKHARKRTEASPKSQPEAKAKPGKTPAQPARKAEPARPARPAVQPPARKPVAANRKSRAAVPAKAPAAKKAPAKKTAVKGKKAKN